MWLNPSYQKTKSSTKSKEIHSIKDWENFFQIRKLRGVITLSFLSKVGMQCFKLKRKSFALCIQLELSLNICLKAEIIVIQDFCLLRDGSLNQSSNNWKDETTLRTQIWVKFSAMQNLQTLMSSYLLSTLTLKANV